MSTEIDANKTCENKINKIKFWFSKLKKDNI